MLEISGKTYSSKYERNASASYMVVEAEYEANIFNYQIEMIANNPNAGVLPLSVRRADNSIKLYYDITSKVSLEWLMKRRKLTKQEFISILCGITKPLLEACGYFLKESSFVLNENYIFVSPDLTEISLVYLPVLSETDYLKSFKDLVLKFITELAKIEESPGDNYLQRIIGNIKEEGFSILSFDRLLKELSFNQSPEAITLRAEEHQACNKPEPLLIPPQKDGIERNMGVEKESSIDRPTGKRSLITIILLQVLLISGIAALLKSGIACSIIDADPTSAYFGLALIAGAIDFLAVRSILTRKERASKEEFNKVDVSKPVSPHVKESKTKQSSSRKNKFITIEKRMANDTTVESKKDNITTEEPCNFEASTFQTEFLHVYKDIEPYLKSEKDRLDEKIIICKDQFSIGRLKGQVDYSCSNNAVGKLHAEITKRDGLFFIKDLNSRNGTFVNNKRIDSNTEYEIKNKDRVALANSEYIFIVP